MSEEESDYPQNSMRRVWIAGLASATAALAHCATGSVFARSAMAYPPAAFDVSDGRALIGVHATREISVHVRWAARDTTSAPLDKRSAVASLNRASNFSGTIPLINLPSNRNISYAVFIDDERISDVQRFRSPPAANRRGSFVLAFSGDMEERYRPFRIFDSIAAQNIDVFLHLGDTVYADIPKRDFSPTLAHYRRKHAAIRADRSLQNFLSQTATIAIWDDHEIENGADSTHSAIETAEQAFREFWPVRTTTPSHAGLYREFSFGEDIALFVLDTRRFRSPQSIAQSGTKTMLGREQLQWFLSAYRASKARYRIIATSVPFHGSSKDAWGNYEHERDVLAATFHDAFRELGAITLLLSADYHFAREWTRSERKGIYEFTAGPLATFLTFQKDNGSRARHSRGTHLVYGESANFCVLRYDEKTRSLRVSYLDDKGKTLNTRSIA